MLVKTVPLPKVAAVINDFKSAFVVWVTCCLVYGSCSLRGSVSDCFWWTLKTKEMKMLQTVEILAVIERREQMTIPMLTWKWTTKIKKTRLATQMLNCCYDAVIFCWCCQSLWNVEFFCRLFYCDLMSRYLFGSCVCAFKNTFDKLNTSCFLVAFCSCPQVSDAWSVYQPTSFCLQPFFRLFYTWTECNPQKTRGNLWYSEVIVDIGLEIKLVSAWTEETKRVLRNQSRS